VHATTDPKEFEMYTIAGATGHVGSAAAERLLQADVPVRVIVRDPAKGAAWAARGAEVAVADLADRRAMSAALEGSDGCFVLLPFDLAAEDFWAQARAQVDAIAGAVDDSGVPHVVALSSIGADLSEGTGPIVTLHHLESALRSTRAVITAVRSGHFQESVSEVLEPARTAGIFPVFASSADVARSRVATKDIGEVVAEALLEGPASSEIIDLEGPRSTDREVARLLGQSLGKQLEVVTIPRDAWIPTLVDAGFPAHLAETLVGLYEADDRGLLQPRGDRTVRCTTPLERTLAMLVGAPV
jgi:uncharacterized protein YbjT (DUF2867 family)